MGLGMVVSCYELGLIVMDVLVVQEGAHDRYKDLLVVVVVVVVVVVLVAVKGAGVATLFDGCKSHMWVLCLHLILLRQANKNDTNFRLNILARHNVLSCLLSH